MCCVRVVCGVCTRWTVILLLALFGTHLLCAKGKREGGAEEERACVGERERARESVRASERVREDGTGKSEAKTLFLVRENPREREKVQARVRASVG